MKKLKYLIIALLFLSVSGRLNAEETWKHLDGLPCEETTSITQDAQGFLWFGTRLGLVCYDGYQLQIYRNDMRRPHAFSSCDIKSLAADKMGKLYAGAFYGMNTFDTHTQQISSTHFKGNDFVRALHADGQGRVFAGTYKGLYCLSPDGETQRIDGIPQDLVVQIRESADSLLFIVTANNGIFVLHPDLNCRALEYTMGLQTRALAQDRQGTLWIGTEHRGLFSFNDDRLVRHAGFDDCRINDLLISSDQVYIATDQGCYRYPLNAYSGELSANIHAIPQLKGKHIQALFEDQNGNIWASTDGHGIWFARRNDQQLQVEPADFTRQTTPIISQFKVRSLNDSDLWKSIPYINCIYEDNDHNTWIGTWNEGFYLTRNGKIVKHFDHKNTPWLHRNDIYAFTMLTSGLLLFSSWEGLYLYDPTRDEGKFLAQTGETDVSSMHTLCIEGNKDLWLGLVGGIAHLQADADDWSQASLTLYTHVNVPGMKQPQNVGDLTDRHSESGEYQLGGIYRIVTDKRGNLWACTSEPGLLRYDAEKDCFRSVSNEMGIPGDNVHSMDIDEQGFFWMTTNYGILKLALDEQGKVVYQQLFTQDNGLPASYFGSTMTTRLADGRIAFLNPDNLIVSAVQPHHSTHRQGAARLSRVLVNGVGLADTDADWDLLPPYTSKLTLTHNRNSLTLFFSSLSFGDENSTRYTYQLKGVDSGRQQTAIGENTIHYNQLQPGTYVLHYAVAGSTEDVETLTIEILQPLWWRWWARMIYLLVLAAIAYFIVHSLIERNRKNQELALLAMEKQALDEQYRSKMQFYTRVIHEFLTPLTLMSELTHELQQKVRPALQATLFMLSSQTDKLLDAMNNTLDIHEEDNSLQEALAKAKEMTQTDRDFLRRCTKSVNAHIADEDYTHQVMMQEVGASHATLYRKLKALTGMDATSFIRSIRMKAACQILASEPGIRISELAGRVGFSNPKYFTTCFKTEFGITPREYLKV